MIDPTKLEQNDMVTILVNGREVKARVEHHVSNSIINHGKRCLMCTELGLMKVHFVSYKDVIKADIYPYREELMGGEC